LGRIHAGRLRHYAPHACAPYLKVVRKRKPVSKKEFFGLVVLVCLLNFLLQIWYVGNAGDFIANYAGYPISVFIIPIFISQLLPCIALSASSKSLALKQKLQLFGIPCFVSVCLVCGFYLVMQYGG
tara:strand:+ start:3859 stop:4236 length:378 start_codon:yes stop_codon:yes gene_type:complete